MSLHPYVVEEYDDASNHPYFGAIVGEASFIRMHTRTHRKWDHYKPPVIHNNNTV